MMMKKINRWLIFLLCVPTVAFAQQNSLLQSTVDGFRL